MGTETDSLAKAANTHAVLTSKSEGMAKEVKELQGQLAELNIILDKVGRHPPRPPVWIRTRLTLACVCVHRQAHLSPKLVSGVALRQLVVPLGWGNPAGRVDTPASPVLPLEGAGHVDLTRLTSMGDV